MDDDLDRVSGTCGMKELYTMVQERIATWAFTSPVGYFVDIDKNHDGNSSADSDEGFAGLMLERLHLERML